MNVILIIMIFQYTYNNISFFPSNTSLCSVQESTYYSLCKHEGSLWYSAWAYHMLILLHAIILKSQLALTTVCLIIVVLDCVNYYHYITNPLNAEINPICHLLALLGGATIVNVSRLRVKSSNITRCLPSRYKLGHWQICCGSKLECR
jgi:hypothetical protein